MNPSHPHAVRRAKLLALMLWAVCASSSAPAQGPTPTAVIEAPRAPSAPLPFADAVARAGQALFAQAREGLGDEPRALVIDPLIDANTGAQTVSSAGMGTQLEALVARGFAPWSVQPLTRASLAAQPLLLIGTLTPASVEPERNAPPDAFRVWLTLIDLRSGRVVAKQLDRASVDSVNAEPLPYYRDSPTWHQDRTVLGYIRSCQLDTRLGDPADPNYLARLPAAAVINEATLAYGDGKTQLANRLYRQAEPLAARGDLRGLNGLYLTSWQLGLRDAAKDAFDRIVESGLERKRLPLKMLFQPGKTAFIKSGDLAQQYRMWITSLARQVGKVSTCVRVVGHTSRTGSALNNEILSRQRADAVERLLDRSNVALTARLSASGVGSKEALIGLGTDDQRDALDRRVEFRVVDCD